MTLTHWLELGYGVCIIMLAIGISLVPEPTGEEKSWFDWHNK